MTVNRCITRWKISTARACCSTMARALPARMHCGDRSTCPTRPHSNCCWLMAATPTSRPLQEPLKPGGHRCCARLPCADRLAISLRCSRPGPIPRRAHPPASVPGGWRCRSGCQRWWNSCAATVRRRTCQRRMSSWPPAPALTRSRHAAFRRGILTCQARCPRAHCGYWPTPPHGDPVRRSR